MNKGNTEKLQQMAEFGARESGARFAKGDNNYRGYRSYKNINLNNLEDKELKMYNDRGWAYDLSMDEDIVLLNEKIYELDTKIDKQTSPTLYNNC